MPVDKADTWGRPSAGGGAEVTVFKLTTRRNLAKKRVWIGDGESIFPKPITDLVGQPSSNPYSLRAPRIALDLICGTHLEPLVGGGLDFNLVFVPFCYKNNLI